MKQKRIIRLTESEFNRMIKNVINEAYGFDDYDDSEEEAIEDSHKKYCFVCTTDPYHGSRSVRNGKTLRDKNGYYAEILFESDSKKECFEEALDYFNRKYDFGFKSTELKSLKKDAKLFYDIDVYADKRSNEFGWNDDVYDYFITEWDYIEKRYCW